MGYNWVIFHSHVGWESNPEKKMRPTSHMGLHTEKPSWADLAPSLCNPIGTCPNQVCPEYPCQKIRQGLVSGWALYDSLCHYVLDLYHFLSLCRNDLGHPLVFTPATVSNRGTLLQRSNRVPSPKRFDRFGSPPSCWEPRKMVIPPHQPHINIH